MRHWYCINSSVNYKILIFKEFATGKRCTFAGKSCATTGYNAGTGHAGHCKKTYPGTCDRAKAWR